MTRMERLKESRKGATVAFTTFTRLKARHDTDLFCCFEGDDVKYYGLRIEHILNIDIDNVHFLNCGGKSEVLKLFEMINKDSYYSSVKIAYFVDRDYDSDIPERFHPKVYQTPCYSIENFYTTLTTFKKILKYEFNMTEDNEDYKVLLSLFISRQEEFHKKTAALNIWLWCQRDRFKEGSAHRLNLDSFNLKKIVQSISLREITADYDIPKLMEIFPRAEHIPEADYLLKQKEVTGLKAQQRFRGKFEIDFLFEFIESIKMEFTSETPLIKKHVGVKINQSKKNLISELSQYASTPDSLVKYLRLIYPLIENITA
ncbi:DUF4435 domain-containing protein [Paenibacillus sp. MER 180]|uniref:DUF4435 domain-containing protein n=1 Tax=Paenibacillus sp. MER 180 TaxID=2939570 RepID=UPI00203CC3FE|nr:DUF4435 domain-containing protein [Paenibacillus sp. MER 180]MCM3294089.1 DUF4435 domain-containing protein [Paenibacillus sp. MER 180]